MSQPQSLQEQIIARAMTDDAFRQALLKNPKEAVERTLGLSLPEGVTLQVHEDASKQVHVELSSQPQAGGMLELSDTDLEQVVGGVQQFSRSQSDAQKSVTQNLSV